MNDFLYGSFRDSELIDPLLEEEEKTKKREDTGLLTPGKQQLVDLAPEETETSNLSSPGFDMSDVQAGAEEYREELEDLQLNTAMEMGLKDSVQELSKNDRAAKELELPMEVIETDPEGAARQVKIKQSKELLELTPKTKAIMADLEKSRGMTHSIEEMSYWEVLAQDAEHGFTQGERMVDLSRLGFEAKHTDDPIKRKEYFDEIRSIQAAMAVAPKTESIFGGASTVASTTEQLIIMREFLKESLPSALVGAGVNIAGMAPGGPGAMAVGGGVGFLSGFTAGAMKFSSEFEEGGSYTELLNDGVDPEVAYHISTGVGVINGLLEVGAFGVLAKPIKDALVKSFIKDATNVLTNKTTAQAFKAGGKVYLATMAKELGIELGQETTNIVGGEIGREMSGKEAKIFSSEGREEIVHQYLEIADKTLKSLLLLSAPGGAATTIVELRDVRAAKNAELFMTAIGDSAQSSEAAEMLPDRYQETIREITKDGPIENVYINANGFQEVFQENAEAVAEELGVADQLADALSEANGSLEIPIGVYAAKVARDEKSHKALMKHGKFDPASKTPFEMENHVKDMEIKAEKILEGSEDRQAITESADRVASHIKSELEAAGRHTPDQINEKVTLHRAFAITNSHIMGMLPHELYGDVGVESVTKPLTITRQQYEEQGMPSTKDLLTEGYDAVRIEKVGDQPGETFTMKDILEAEGKAQQQTQALDQAAEATKQEPGFKEFIKDSKVVDEKGDPLVVYHGTAAEEFSTFNTDPDNDLGAHFGTEGHANSRLTYRGRNKVAMESGSRIIPVYLDIKNPLRLPDIMGGMGWDVDSLKDELLSAEVITEADMDRIETQADIREAIENAGYDGIVYANEGETSEVPTKVKELREKIKIWARDYMNDLDAVEQFEWRSMDKDFLSDYGKLFTAEDLEFYQENKDTFFSGKIDEIGDFETKAFQDSYIAFHPEQIKSIFAEKFDPASPDILEQAAAVKAEPGFKEFIKDSKVVDEAGEPLVVYHGTTNPEDFKEFKTRNIRQVLPEAPGKRPREYEDAKHPGDLGAYFTPDTDMAGHYAGDPETSGMFGDPYQEDARIIPVYLAIKNPLVVEAADYAKILMHPEEIEKWNNYADMEEDFDRERIPDNQPQLVRDLLKKADEGGHDGIIIKGDFEGTPFDDLNVDQYIAFHPEQIKSIFAEKFDPASPNILEQSAVPIQKKPLKIEGTGKKGKITNWDIADAFTKRHDEKYGRKLDPQNNEEDYKIVLRELNKEYKDQAKKEDAGADWYIQDINEAVEITKLIIPELSDPIKKDVFLAIVAFTSPNNNPINNWEVAVQVMQGYLKTGKIPTKRENGKNLGVTALRLNTQLFQKLITMFGEKGALQWISEPKTGREMAQLRMDSGLYTKKKTLAGYVAGETNLSSDYPFGAAAMGPKVSEFFANVVGLDQESVTVDLWAARTYNRMIGRLLDVSKGKAKSKTIVQDLRGKAERDIIKRLFRDLAKKNNVDPSAMQAALWYFEQRLFRNHGAIASSENFTGGATRAAGTRKIDIPRTSEDAQGTLQTEAGNLREIPWNEKGEITKLFIRGPWDEKIISGGKTLEVRGRAIPAKHIGVPIVLKNENNEALGEVVFKGSRQVKTAKEFNKLRKQHQVEKGSEFDFGSRKETHVWEIESVKPYTQPQKLAPMKGQAPFQVEKKIEGPQELYQDEVAEEVNPTWYYSTLADAVHNLKPSKAQPKSAEEWLNIIRKLPGVKKGEIAATGLENYLGLDHRKYLIAEAENKVKARQGVLELHGSNQHQGLKEMRQKKLDEAKAELDKVRRMKQPKFTHDQIKQYLNDNGVKLVDVTNGIPQDGSEFAWYEEKMEEIDYAVQVRTGEIIAEKMDDFVYDLQYGRAVENLKKLKAGADPKEVYADKYTAFQVTVLMDTRMKLLPGWTPENFTVEDLVDWEWHAINKEISEFEEHTPSFGEEVTNPIWEKLREMKREARKQAEADFLDERRQVKREGVTKFTEWMHEGGENYTEWLITLPENKMAVAVPAEAHALRKKIIKWAEMKAKDAQGGGNQSQRVAAWLGEFKVNAGTANFLALKSNSDIFTKDEMHYYYRHAERYFSVLDYVPLLKETHGTRFFNPPVKEYKHDSHFPNPNILVHIRADERWSLVGKQRGRVLYLQEIQSDWADARRSMAGPVADDMVRYDPPPAPFIDETKEYTALALKRMIHHAISNGVDRIEWTSGLQQDTRYDMERFISGIIWNPDTKVLRARPRGEKEFVDIADHVEEADLPKYIGGDAAARLIRTEPPSPVIIAKFEQLRLKREALLAEWKRLDNEFKGLKLEGQTIENPKKLQELGQRRSEAFEENHMYDDAADQAFLDRITFSFGLSIADIPKKDKVFEVADRMWAIREEQHKIALDEGDVVEHINDLENKTGAGIEGLEANDKALSGVEVQVATDGMKDYYDKILPSVARDVLKKLGVKNAKIDPAGDLTPEEYTMGHQPGFDLAQVREALTDGEGKAKRIALFQGKRGLKRGSFRANWDDFTKDKKVITLLEDADLSTFLHETGHFFFEATRHFASQPEAPQEMKDNMNALLNFIGVSDLTTWNNMTFEERRPGHEKAAKAFEVYLFEGKAPTPELADMFRRFRDWLVAVYDDIRKQLDVTLTDDVRNAFDRMLATKEEIELNRQAKGLDPMFVTKPEWMDNVTWKAYQATNRKAQDESDEAFEARILDNMRWESGARGRVLAQMQREENARREGVRLDATRRIAGLPVYQAKAFLRQPVEKKKKAKSNPAVVDPTQDSLLTAIAKLGGLIKTEVVQHWGIDPKEKIASGTIHHVLRTTGGLTRERMAEALADLGYLPVDVNGKWDLHDFEERFADARFGNKRYSIQNDEYEFAEDYENFVATEEGLQPLDESVINGKLSIPAMRELYGNVEGTTWMQLPTGRYGMAAEEEGLHPDVVAKRFGFSSGDEMIEALVNAPPLRDAVKTETDARMVELYGDMKTPEEREQAINVAIHNEATTRRMHLELDALSAEYRGRGNILVSEAKAWAEEKISRMTIRSLRPTQYFANERRDNRQAERALAQGNRKAALEHKRAAVLNYHFARAAVNALDEVDKAIRYFNSFDRKGTQKTVAKDQLDQIYAALEKYDIRRSVTHKEADRRASLAQWIAQQEELGLVPNIDPRLLESTQPKPYKEVPIEELRGLRDSIKSIEHLGRLKNKLLVAAGERNLEEAVDQLAKEIIKNSKKKKRYTVLETETPDEKRSAFVRGLFAAQRKFGDIIRQFDGWVDGRANFQFVLRPLEERTQWENEQKAKSTRRLAEIMSRYSAFEQRRNTNTKVYIKSIDDSLTKNGMLAVALNWGNSTNQQRIMGGHNWDINQVQGDEGILSHLDQRDWDFVQEVWDFIDEFWPEIKAKEERIAGVSPEKVEALPVNTKFGQYRGGYYPIKYNRKSSKDAYKHFIEDIAESMKKGAFSRAMTKHGFANERVKADIKMPVRLDIGVFFEHVNEVIHDLAFHEVLIDMGRILNHPKYSETVIKHYGPELFTQLKTTMEDVAQGDIPAVWEGEQFLNWLRMGSTIAGIALNMGTVVLQVTGLFQSMQRIGVQWVFRGMARFFIGGPGMEAGLKWIQANSSFMRDRPRTINREIGDIRNRVQQSNAVQGIRSVVGESYFYMIVKTQLLADVPTWLGMYEKAMAKGVDGKPVDHQTAVIMADRAVKDAQASGDMMDLARVQKGSPGWKLFTNFYSFFSATYNRMHESWTKMSIKNPLSVGRFAVDFLLLTSFPVAAEFMGREVLLRGGCDEGRDLECVGEKLITAHATYLMSMYVGLRELTGAVQGFDYSGPTGSRIFSEAGKLIQQSVQLEPDRALVRAINQVTGILFHLPAAAQQRFIDAFWDASEGEDVRPTAPLFGQARE